MVYKVANLHVFWPFRICGSRVESQLLLPLVVDQYLVTIFLQTVECIQCVLVGHLRSEAEYVNLALLSDLQSVSVK
jgi:hypothetical protein